MTLPGFAHGRPPCLPGRGPSVEPRHGEVRAPQVCSLEVGAAKGRCGVRRSCQLTSRVTRLCHPVTQATFETRSPDPVPTDPPNHPPQDLAEVQLPSRCPEHLGLASSRLQQLPVQPGSTRDPRFLWPPHLVALLHFYVGPGSPPGTLQPGGRPLVLERPARKPCSPTPLLLLSWTRFHCRPLQPGWPLLPQLCLQL